MTKPEHPDEKTMKQWISNLLPFNEMREIDLHLEHCQFCSGLLEATLRTHSHPLEKQYSASVSIAKSAGASNSSAAFSGRSEVRGRMNREGAVKPNLPFEIIDIYESGGIGKIWRAYERKLNRIIAVKKLRKNIATEVSVQTRFMREARITGQLAHPGIVPVYQLLDQGRHSCYSMPLLNGVTLTKKIDEYHRDLAKEEGRFSDFLRLLEAFVAICNTIAYAHSKDVIHRDLKSDNVMLGEFGEVTVLDWGLAKRLDEDGDEFDGVTIRDTLGSSLSTLEGQRLGTPSFMSPEQAAGQLELVGKPSDIYGLSAILYEVLTGRPPFVKEDVEATLSAVVSDEVLRPSQCNAKAPPELEEICVAGLSKDISRRPNSAKELGKKVRAWLSDQAERKRSEQERQRFFAMSVDMLAILDGDFQICEANKAWRSSLGLSRNELAGRAFIERIHPDDVEKTNKILEKAIAGETQTEFEIRLRNESDQYRWTQWNATPIKEDRQIYIIGRDITQRRGSEQMFSQLFDSAPDAMIVSKANSEIFLVNSQAEKLLGYSRHELIGKGLEVLMPQRFRVNHQQKVDSFFANPAFRPMGKDVRLFARHKDGSEFLVQISLSPVATEMGSFVSNSIRPIRESETGE